MAKRRMKTLVLPGLSNTYYFAEEAEEFSTSKAYAIGDYCIYEGVLYRFTVAHAAGAWNAAHVTDVFLADDVKALRDSAIVNAHHYGAKWDKTTHTMTRTGDAAGITTTLTNFAHRGAVNANYDNPFDSIYPWSGCKLCNIDLEAYMALTDGDDFRTCVVAWEGDADFSYTHVNGVWKYRPEFWGSSWDDGGYRYFDICDRDCAGYVHYKPEIIGRWRGVEEARTIGGSEKTILLPKPGMPSKLKAMRTIHGYAKNAGLTLDSIFSIDGSYLMAIIEAADFNVQLAWGNGVSAMYRQSSDLLTADVSDSNVIRVASSASDVVGVGTIIDIGTANGGAQVGSFYVTAVETDGTDKVLTLDRNLTATTANFWSAHGRINIADEQIGSKSGYIGTNGRADCYYRGEVFWGNIWLYTLGVYHQATTNHVWLAKSDADADNYDEINTTDHIDTGIALASAGGWIKSIEYLGQSGKLACPIFCVETGGNSTNPIGDYYYVNAGANTILIVGGNANNGDGCGLYWSWGNTASNANWNYGGRPRLKTP